jgi:hypothetical protein
MVIAVKIAALMLAIVILIYWQWKVRVNVVIHRINIIMWLLR